MGHPPRALRPDDQPRVARTPQARPGCVCLRPRRPARRAADCPPTRAQRERPAPGGQAPGAAGGVALATRRFLPRQGAGGGGAHGAGQALAEGGGRAGRGAPPAGVARWAPAVCGAARTASPRRGGSGPAPWRSSPGAAAPGTCAPPCPPPRGWVQAGWRTRAPGAALRCGRRWAWRPRRWARPPRGSTELVSVLERGQLVTDGKT